MSHSRAQWPGHSHVATIQEAAIQYVALNCWASANAQTSSPDYWSLRYGTVRMCVQLCEVLALNDLRTERHPST